MTGAMSDSDNGPTMLIIGRIGVALIGGVAVAFCGWALITGLTDPPGGPVLPPQRPRGARHARRHNGCGEGPCRWLYPDRRHLWGSGHPVPAVFGVVSPATHAPALGGIGLHARRGGRLATSRSEDAPDPLYLDTRLGQIEGQADLMQ